MDTPSALALLSLPPHATRGDLRRAYRRLAVLTHPDTGGDGRAFTRLTAAVAHLERVLTAGPATLHLARPRFAPRQRPSIAPGGDYTPWSGADWTGAASGLAWTPTPAPVRRRHRR